MTSRRAFLSGMAAAAVGLIGHDAPKGPSTTVAAEVNAYAVEPLRAPLALALSAAHGIDLETASRMVGRVSAENRATIKRYLD